MPMAGLFSETIFGIPWVIVAALALVVSVVYLFVDTGANAEGLRWVVLRWFHPLCWLFLSSAALARAKITPIPVDWAGGLAVIGGVLYAVFAILWFTRGA